MKINLPITDIEVNFPEGSNLLSTTNLKGTITYVNDTFIRISGFEKEELLQKNHNVVRHPDMPPSAFEQMWKRLKAGHSWMGLVKNRCKNGAYYWVNAYVTPIRENGQVVEYQSVRTSPEPDQVARANKLYARLREGKKMRRSLASRLTPVHQVVLGSLLVGALATGVLSLLSSASVITTALLGLSIFLISAGCGLFAVWPLQRVVRNSRQIVDDPMAAWIYTGRDDAAGQLAFAIRYLQTEAHAIAGRIQDSALQLSHNAEALASAVEKGNEGIHCQQRETDQVAAAMTEMSASIHQVSQHTQQSATSSECSNQLAQEGGHCVVEARHTIERLAGEIENTSTVISDLGKSAEKITDVLEAIAGIAEQTNLLALNAAIEAARAGEQGRGFAVVADEVRGLATRSKYSTEEIRDTLSNLRQHSVRAVQTMEQCRQLAQQTVEQARQVSAKLTEITHSVDDISDRNTQIASAMEQQGKASDEISHNLIVIRDSLDHFREESSQTEHAALALAQLSTELSKLSDNFWQRGLRS